MNVNLLREMIGLVIEKIRTEKGVSSKMGEKFSINKFKEFDEPHIAMNYAEQFLEPIGTGSSRKTFLLSSKYALKIAINKAGVGQNEAEIDVFTNPKTKPIVSKIYSSGPNNSWLISDLVKPITDEKEFEKLAGVSWPEFQYFMNIGYDNKQPDPDSPQFVKTVLNFAFSNNMMFGDLAGKGTMDHWGKTPDGRIVLLDSGFTESVAQAHYRKKQKTGVDPHAEKTNIPGSPRDSATKKNVDPFADTEPVEPERDATTKLKGKASVSKTKPSPVNSDSQLKTKRRS